MLANFIITSRSLFEKENLILENWVKGIRYQISDYSGADIRGNYTLTIGTLSPCLLYTSDAADERSSVDLGGRRIIKKKKTEKTNNPAKSKQKKTIR